MELNSVLGFESLSLTQGFVIKQALNATQV